MSNSDQFGNCIYWPAVQSLCSVKLCISRSLRGRLKPLSAPWAEFQMVVGGGTCLHRQKNQCCSTWLCCLTVSVFCWPQGCESWEHTTGRRRICSDCRCVEPGCCCSATLTLFFTSVRLKAWMSKWWNWIQRLDSFMKKVMHIYIIYCQA